MQTDVPGTNFCHAIYHTALKLCVWIDLPVNYEFLKGNSPVLLIYLSPADLLTQSLAHSRGLNAE